MLLATNMFPLVGAMENNNGQQQNVLVPPPTAAQVAQPGAAPIPQAAAQVTRPEFFYVPQLDAQTNQLGIVPIQPSATQTAMPEILPGPPATAQTAQPGAPSVPTATAQAAAQPEVFYVPQAAAQAIMPGIFPGPPATVQTAQPGAPSVPTAAAQAAAQPEVFYIPQVAAQATMPEVFPDPPAAAQAAQPGAFPVPSIAIQAVPQEPIFVPQRVTLPVINPAVSVPVTQTLNATGMFNFMRVPLPYGCNPFLINVVYRAYSCKGLKELLGSSAPNLTPPQDALLYLLDIMDGISPFENEKYMQGVTYLNNFIGDDKPLNSIQQFFRDILGPENNLIDLLAFDINNPFGINSVRLGECNVSKDTVIVDINPKEAFYFSGCMLTNLLELKPKNGLIYDLVCFSCLDTDVKNVCTVIKQEDGNWYEYSNRGVKVLCEHEAVLLSAKAFSLVYHKR